MARKAKTITHLMNNGERQACKMLWRTGVATEKDIRKHFSGISDHRWRLMLKDNIIKKTGIYCFLDTKGKKYLENKMGMTHQYRTRIEHLKHDLKLNKAYLQLPESQRETWKTETQLRHELTSQSKYHDMYNDPKFDNFPRKNFIPDATVYSEELQQEIVLEVVTSSYSISDIEQKIETATKFYSGEYYQI